MSSEVCEDGKLGIVIILVFIVVILSFKKDNCIDFKCLMYL